MATEPDKELQEGPDPSLYEAAPLPDMADLKEAALQGVVRPTFKGGRMEYSGYKLWHLALLLIPIGFVPAAFFFSYWLLAAAAGCYVVYLFYMAIVSRGWLYLDFRKREMRKGALFVPFAELKPTSFQVREGEHTTRLEVATGPLMGERLSVFSGPERQKQARAFAKALWRTIRNAVEADAQPSAATSEEKDTGGH